MLRSTIFRYPALLVLVLLPGLLAGLPARSEPIDTAARQALVLDYDTGTVLMEKNADQLMAPSSMSKLMLVYMVFERLKAGSLKLTDEFTVSERAWKKFYKTDASLMFLPLNSRVSVSDLLRGVIVQSGNDACSVLAEGIWGSEETFAEQGTREGKSIGLTNSVFKNASGWPEPGHVMTARDLATLGTRLIHDFPEYYSIFSEMDFTYNKIKQGNRNPLLYDHVGADGLKTGHTDEGGYGLTGSAVRDGHRVILVLNGLPSMKSRTTESATVLDWAFREFTDLHPYKAGAVVADAKVWLGQAPSVSLAVARAVVMTVPRATSNAVKVSVVYDEPIPAPIKEGQQVGTLKMEAPGLAAIEVPLVATASVAKIGFFGRISAALAHFVHGSSG